MFAPIAPDALRRRRRDGEPRDRDRDRRLARPEELQLPRAAERVRGAARRRASTWSPWRTTTGATTGRRDSRRRSRPRQQTPLDGPRHRRERDRGVRAVGHRGEGSAPRVLRRDRRARRLAHHPVDRDRHAGRARVDQGRRRRPARRRDPGGPPDGRHGRRRPALGGRGLDLPVAAPAGARPAADRRRRRRRRREPRAPGA